MNAEQTALLDRWNAFLAKIDGRLREIMAEAEQGLVAIWTAHPDDPLPFGNAISGLDHRVRELRNKVDETWEQQVEEKFSDAGGEFLDVGLDRKQDFLQTFDETWSTFKVRASTAFHRNLWPLAQAAMQKPVACNRCGAPLLLPNRHEPHSLSCPHCGAANQVIPEGVVSMWLEGAGHAFGEEAALPVRHRIERFRIEVDRRRRAADWAPEPVESLDQWEAMEREYWTTYAEARARATGRSRDDELIESRMRSFRQYTLETDQRWRRAKGL